MNFFKAVQEFFDQIGMFITNVVSSLLNAVLLIGNLPSFMEVLIGFVPPIIGASLTAVLAIGIVKLVLGWGNSQ